MGHLYHGSVSHNQRDHPHPLDLLMKPLSKSQTMVGYIWLHTIYTYIYIYILYIIPSPHSPNYIPYYPMDYPYHIPIIHHENHHDIPIIPPLFWIKSPF